MLPRVLLILLSFALLALPARAQDPHPDLEQLAPGTVFSPLSFEEAFKEAQRQHRLLVVYLYDQSVESDMMNRTTWRNPTLAAYIRWHCIAIKMPGSGEPCPDRRRDSILLTRYPAVRIYAPPDRHSLQCLATKHIAMGDHMVLGLTTDAGAAAGSIPIQGVDHDIVPGPINVLYQSQISLERKFATEPAWGLLHDHQNPAPQAPPMPPPFYLKDDDRGEVIEDPPLDAPPINVWDRLETARRAVRTGNLHGATGLYTWLWERSAQVDPAFAAVRRTVLAAEIADLAGHRKGARERFAQIRDAHSERLLWAEYDELLEWSVLNGVAADDGLTLEWFNLFANDDDEASMMPRADKLAYQAILGREHFADTFELGKDPVGRVERVSRMAAGGRPRLVQPEDWDRLRAFLRAYLIEEGSRLHAACLKAGREDDARTIANMVLKIDSDGLVRRSLVAVALAAGQPRTMHLAILGDLDPDLAARVRAVLSSPADPPASPPP